MQSMSDSQRNPAGRGCRRAGCRAPRACRKQKWLGGHCRCESQLGTQMSGGWRPPATSLGRHDSPGEQDEPSLAARLQAVEVVGVEVRGSSRRARLRTSRRRSSARDRGSRRRRAGLHGDADAFVRRGDVGAQAAELVPPQAPSRWARRRRAGLQDASGRCPARRRRPGRAATSALAAAIACRNRCRRAGCAAKQVIGSPVGVGAAAGIGGAGVADEDAALERVVVDRQQPSETAPSGERPTRASDRRAPLT